VVGALATTLLLLRILLLVVGDKAMAMILLRLGTVVRVMARAVKARESGIVDGRYRFWSVLQPVHPQGERT
jgi:hypothetical protein